MNTQTEREKTSVFMCNSQLDSQLKPVVRSDDLNVFHFPLVLMCQTLLQRK